MKLEDIDYQNMTKGEKNEIIAYAAGMLQCRSPSRQAQ